MGAPVGSTMSIYMMGHDSYTFTLDDVTVVVHAGSPPTTKPVQPPPEPPNGATTKPGIDPVLPLAKPDLKPPDLLELVAPTSRGELEVAFASNRTSDAELAVDVSEGEVDIQEVLAALRAEPGDLTVHVIDEQRGDG